MTDIAIVGGSPAALGLAIALARRGIPTTVSSGMPIQKLRRALTQIDPTQLIFPGTDSGRCAT